MNVEMEEIEPHFNPGQPINDFPGGYYDVTLINKQYPDGLELAQGDCIKIANVSGGGGFGGEGIRGDLEGKIATFIHRGAKIDGIKLVDGKEILIDTAPSIYDHQYETDFENVEIVPCANGGGRRRHKHKSVKRKRTHKRTHKRAHKKKTRRNRKY